MFVTFHEHILKQHPVFPIGLTGFYFKLKLSFVIFMNLHIEVLSFALI